MFPIRNTYRAEAVVAVIGGRIGRRVLIEIDDIRRNIGFARGRAARHRDLNVDCLLGIGGVPLAPYQLRSALWIYDIPDRVHLVLDIKSYGHRIVGSMFAACYGDACINIGINTIFIITRRDFDFFLRLFERNDSDSKILDNIAVGHIGVFRTRPSGIAEIVLFEEHRKRQIFMRERTHFIDHLAARLHIVQSRLGSRHRSSYAVERDIHDRLDHQFIIAVCQIVKLNSRMLGYTLYNLFICKIAANFLNACS